MPQRILTILGMSLSCILLLGACHKSALSGPKKAIISVNEQGNSVSAVGTLQINANYVVTALQVSGGISLSNKNQLSCVQYSSDSEGNSTATDVNCELGENEDKVPAIKAQGNAAGTLIISASQELGLQDESPSFLSCFTPIGEKDQISTLETDARSMIGYPENNIACSILQQGLKSGILNPSFISPVHLYKLAKVLARVDAQTQYQSIKKGETASSTFTIADLEAAAKTLAKYSDPNYVSSYIAASNALTNPNAANLDPALLLPTAVDSLVKTLKQAGVQSDKASEAASADALFSEFLDTVKGA